MFWERGLKFTTPNIGAKGIMKGRGGVSLNTVDSMNVKGGGELEYLSIGINNIYGGRYLYSEW